jgi:hypothetical protein
VVVGVGGAQLAGNTGVGGNWASGTFGSSS